jgi:hypothetical protein
MICESKNVKLIKDYKTIYISNVALAANITEISAVLTVLKINCGC